MAKDNLNTEKDLIKWVNDNKSNIDKLVEFYDAHRAQEDESESEEPVVEPIAESSEMTDIPAVMNVLKCIESLRLDKTHNFPYYKGRGHLIEGMYRFCFRNEINHFEFYCSVESHPIVDTFLRTKYNCFCLKQKVGNIDSVFFFAFRKPEELFAFLSLAQLTPEFRLTVPYDEFMAVNFEMVQKFMRPAEHAFYSALVNEKKEKDRIEIAAIPRYPVTLKFSFGNARLSLNCADCDCMLEKTEGTTFSCCHGICPHCIMDYHIIQGTNIFTSHGGERYKIDTTTCKTCQKTVSFPQVIRKWE